MSHGESNSSLNTCGAADPCRPYEKGTGTQQASCLPLLFVVLNGWLGFASFSDEF